jgi:2-oxoglutarate dehydrogenase E2 component (dihydrolipoamide succinyltransferase)
MTVELKVPAVGESITEVQIGDWFKKEGQAVQADEPVVSIETDKVTVELPAPSAGTVTKILKATGETAQVGEIIGYMEAGAVAPAPVAAAPAAATAASPVAAAPVNTPAPAEAARVMPAAQRALHDAGLLASQVSPSGPGGRLLKEDVLKAAAKPAAAPAPAAPKANGIVAGPRQVEVVAMTPLRRKIAERLVQAQHEAALLTTFNEVDMSAVMQLRKEFQDEFTKKYGIKLGFMSFFVRAAVEALKVYPSVNAEIQGTNIVYHNYYDIGVAVGGGKGLVVPIIRNAERFGFAEIEQTIADYGKRAKENKIGLEELQGGTFTISNGGVYGSMLSTPIVNPPQSGILGMHNIEERAVVRNGEVVARPMMYIALTYDHRIIDGREAVGFLKHIKHAIENPARILLEI